MATAKWGKGWQIPTKADFDELLANSDEYYTVYEGRYGWMFTSRINQQSIFFPGAGHIEGTEHHNPKKNGNYMTSTPHGDHLSSYHGWIFSLERNNMTHFGRCYGASIRPVIR